jgi:polar amino acid transport system substrate-binding protein
MHRPRPVTSLRSAALAPFAVLASLSMVSLAACGSTEQAGPTPAGTESAAAASCTKDSLTLVSAGTLTVGTDKPAYEPWFSGDDPTNGKGYESAVAYAIADELGFAKSEVTWVTVPFNTAIAPAPKNFDLDLNQISISDARKKAVDFSSGYYDVRQAVVTYKGSPIDGKATVADLKGAKLAAQVGTTSLTAITDQIQPSEQPQVFDTNDLAVQALKNKQIDGIVVDVPTAFYMTAAQLDDGVIVGQLPASGTPEQFGAVLDKGSALTPCVTKAVDALRSNGTLEKLQTEYLANAGAPELK